MNAWLAKPGDPQDREPEAGSFDQVVGKILALSRLQDLIAWGRKYSLWPFNFGLSC